MILAVPMITIFIGNILMIFRTKTADSKRINLTAKSEQKPTPAILIRSHSTKSHCKISLARRNTPSSLKSLNRKQALLVNRFSFKFKPIYMNEQDQQANVRTSQNQGSKKVF